MGTKSLGRGGSLTVHSSYLVLAESGTKWLSPWCQERKTPWGGMGPFPVSDVFCIYQLLERQTRKGWGAISISLIMKQIVDVKRWFTYDHIDIGFPEEFRPETAALSLRVIMSIYNCNVFWKISKKQYSRQHYKSKIKVFWICIKYTMWKYLILKQV